MLGSSGRRRRAVRGECTCARGGRPLLRQRARRDPSARSYAGNSRRTSATDLLECVRVGQNALCMVNRAEHAPPSKSRFTN
jgi:hypothetical protein